MQYKRRDCRVVEFTLSVAKVLLAMTIQIKRWGEFSPAGGFAPEVPSAPKVGQPIQKSSEVFQNPSSLYYISTWGGEVMGGGC
jgi:hypothetical protein